MSSRYILVTLKVSVGECGVLFSVKYIAVLKSSTLHTFLEIRLGFSLKKPYILSLYFSQYIWGEKYLKAGKKNCEILCNALFGGCLIKFYCHRLKGKGIPWQSVV